MREEKLGSQARRQERKVRRHGRKKGSQARRQGSK